jgi:hypothetical protein
MKSIILRLAMLLCFTVTAIAITACSGGEDGMTVTSSTDYEHNHKVTLPASVLANPADITLTTTEAGNPPHTHTVTLSKGQINNLKSGNLVFIISSKAADGHNHEFTFIIPKATTPTPSKIS